MPNNKQLPYAETIQLIWDIEKKFDVSNITCQGVNIWPILRIAIYNENLWAGIKNEKGTSILQKIRIIPSILRVVFENFLDRKNNLKPTSSDIYFSSHVSSRTYKMEGKWHDFIFSILIEWVQQRNKKLTVFFEEFSGDGNYKYPRYEPSYYFTRYLAAIKLKSILFNSKHYVKETNKEVLNIKRYLDKNNKRSHSLKQLQLDKKLDQFFQLVTYYEKQLLQINPKLVCIETYYSSHGMALIHAAKMRGVRTMDVQHGVQGKLHVAYGTWHHMPNNGYSCLPKQFWVWSAIDKNNLQMGKAHTGVVGGDIQNYYWKNKTLRSNPHTQKLLKIRQKHKVIFLVSLQPGLDFLLDEIIKAISNPSFSHCFWLIRAHPSMNNATLQYLQQKVSPYLAYCDIETATSCRLSEVLSISSGHITVSSSVVIEAANEGIPSLVYSESAEIFLGLVNKHYLFIHQKHNLLLDSLISFLSLLSNQNTDIRHPVINTKEVFETIINTAME